LGLETTISTLELLSIRLFAVWVFSGLLELAQKPIELRIHQTVALHTSISISESADRDAVRSPRLALAPMIDSPFHSHFHSDRLDSRQPITRRTIVDGPELPMLFME
jgi:hypothetical protein